SIDTLINLAWAASALLIISTGQTLLMVSGAADLSVGSMMAMVAVPVIGLLDAGVSIAIAFPLGLATGLAFGALNGMLSEGLRLPSFVVTFGTLAIYRGFAYVEALFVTGGLQSIIVNDPNYIFLGRGYLFGPVPPSLLIA